MASRILSRLLSKRAFNTSAARKSVQEEFLAEEKHAEGTSKTWKMISIFVACPALAICTYNAYVKELEHKAHGTSDFVSYAHLRIRNKPFPWSDGNHSLFHNSHVNALPEGYEH